MSSSPPAWCAPPTTRWPRTTSPPLARTSPPFRSTGPCSSEPPTQCPTAAGRWRWDAEAGRPATMSPRRACQSSASISPSGCWRWVAAAGALPASRGTCAAFPLATALARWPWPFTRAEDGGGRRPRRGGEGLASRRRPVVGRASRGGRRASRGVPRAPHCTARRSPVLERRAHGRAGAGRVRRRGIGAARASRARIPIATRLPAGSASGATARLTNGPVLRR